MGMHTLAAEKAVDNFAYTVQGSRLTDRKHEKQHIGVCNNLGHPSEDELQPLICLSQYL